MNDKKEFPILVQLAPTDDDKEADMQAQLAALQAENARLRKEMLFCKQTADFVLNNPPEKTSPMRALWEISGQLGEALQAKEAAKE